MKYTSPGLHFTKDYSDGFELIVNPPEYATRAPSFTGRVHGYNGGIVNFLLGCQCFNLTIDEMRAIVNKWDEKVKKI